ncbi:MAG: hypothetical protein A3F83_09240 [Candidatus Glassbacteria bacterium RIFCSPLOWO2_12_FULL_58_11]|uniref:Uncharacterized protein n=2 Tax=Candidatus Glassiibacteriota TaxID=1817805 RepID=A0A1F5Z361_9BACT|nr:MAG: hypothetical protein A2Z86_08590 [Candidatus Glassbacteria bacterium GWA2_58_10]OGG06617.1 MAG: hypothetical protein A3F83_09240 [Candidatus Glassbacteria bacterium RIFCSPLOWO2_12_FULL_58_11]
MVNSVDEFYQVSALLDDELRDSEAMEVKKKISGSRRWKKQYEELKALGDLLRLWDELDCRGIRASATFELRLAASLRNLRSRQSSPIILFFPH